MHRLFEQPQRALNIAPLEMPGGLGDRFSRGDLTPNPVSLFHPHHALHVGLAQAIGIPQLNRPTDSL